MFKELINKLAGDSPYIKFNSPANSSDFELVEKKLNVKLPDTLKTLLIEFNGDGSFVLSTTQIIEDNLRMRSIDGFMTLDSLLFVAGNGCGDYFGYAITGDGLRDDLIYFWDHELDNRIYKACSLEELIKKYYSNEI